MCIWIEWKARQVKLRRKSFEFFSINRLIIYRAKRQMSPFPERWHILDHLLLLKWKKRELVYEFTLCMLIHEDSCLRDFPLRAQSLLLGLAFDVEKNDISWAFSWKFIFILGIGHIVNINFCQINLQNQSIKDNDSHLLLFSLLRHMKCFDI